MTENQAILIIGGEEPRVLHTDQELKAELETLRENLKSRGKEINLLEEEVHIPLGDFAEFVVPPHYEGPLPVPDDTPFYKKIHQKGGKKNRRRFY